MTLSPGSRLGPYEILSPLGAGGMGEVYRARDTRLGREVALKVLPEEVSLDKDRLSRFEQEARSASALNHPNIITIYEIGQADHVSFIAMELVEGKTLRELSASDRLPVRRAIGIAVQVAEGLAKAHGAGIVHRDLKPENVMVSKDGYVKILDFGLAKLAEPESGELSAMPTLARLETHPGTVLGTVGYMSPEQASGQSLDFHSDQFSFGSILYEITGGKKAFARKTAAETMSAIIREEPEPLGKLRPDVPPPLRWIIERCLAKDPEERYASTRDLARELAGVRDHISEVSGGAEALIAAPGRPGSRLAPRLMTAGLVLAGFVAGAVVAVNLWKKAPAQAPSFHRLTFRPGPIGNARFAPDGQTIVYGATWTGEPKRMYATRAESPESRPFDFPDADILAISSSGEMAFLLGDAFGRGVLARAPLSGGAAREVLVGVPYASADWSPDGRELAVVRIVEGKSRLECPIGKVILESADELYAPRFSPHGDSIAFFSGAADSISLVVVDVSGKGKKMLSAGWSDVSGVPSWKPDGEEIWFTASQRGEASALRAVNMAGKGRLVARVPGYLELDDISRDGRVLVAHHTIVRILAGLAPGQEKERGLSWLDSSVPADLSPDGKTLVLTETGEGSGATPSIYLRKTDGAPAVRLGEGSAIALSPDGKWVLASVPSGGGRPERLVVLPTGPGESRVLNDRLENFRGAAWLPDGRRFVFAAQEKGHGPRIRVQDLAGGDSRPLSPEGVWIPVATNLLSPDGRFVLGIQGRAKASLYPLEGGEPRPVAGLKADDVPIQWSEDGQFLYVHQRFEVPNKVWLLDPATGKKQPWLEIKPGEPVLALPILLMTRDGKSYVYGAQRVFSELYIVEGLR
ncbi:MAG TPA: protein kinase [Thermoanaerobaculia bacterium]